MQLQMNTNMNGGSRVNTLIQDFLDIPDDLNMENFGQEEPKACMKYLIAATRPTVLKQTVENELNL